MTIEHPAQKYIIIEKDSDDDWSSYWFHQIGWVGYYFAQLEWASYWLTAEVGTPEQQATIGSRGFVARNSYVKKHVVPNLSDNALRADWSNFLDEISASADMRNDILHNPLGPNMDDIQNQGVRLDQGIRLLRDGGGKLLDLGEVQHFTKGLVTLNGKMIGLMQRTSAKP